MHLDICHIWHVWVQKKIAGQKDCAVESATKKHGEVGGQSSHYNVIYDLALHSPTTFSSPT